MLALEMAWSYQDGKYTYGYPHLHSCEPQFPDRVHMLVLQGDWNEEIGLERLARLERDDWNDWHDIHPYDLVGKFLWFARKSLRAFKRGTLPCGVGDVCKRTPVRVVAFLFLAVAMIYAIRGCHRITFGIGSAVFTHKEAHLVYKPGDLEPGHIFANGEKFRSDTKPSDQKKFAITKRSWYPTLVPSNSPTLTPKVPPTKSPTLTPTEVPTFTPTTLTPTSVSPGQRHQCGMSECM